MTTQSRIVVGVSACLLGEPVRFDGGHKRSAYVVEQLQRFFAFEAFCPEMAIGLGVPRQPVRLVGDLRRPRVVGVKDAALDVTEALEGYAARVAQRAGHLSGYVVKKGSPSCGMERVKVYGASGMSQPEGVGAYTRVLMEALPLLPVEEEGRLMDPLLRENFIERVYIYHRWQSLVASGMTPAKLVDFHAALKLTLLARGQQHYRRLGQAVAQAGVGDFAARCAAYIADLMRTLTLRATRPQHSNVLQHLAGYLKKALTAPDKAELIDVIDSYRRGHVPLVVPITLFKHYFRRFPNAYIARQQYLNPHPAELMLRNTI